MFKELKILKLSLSAIFLMVIIWNVVERNQFFVLITEQASYFQGEDAMIYQAGNFSREESIQIANLEGKIIFEKKADFQKNIDHYSCDTDFALKDGIRIEISDTFPSGIYTINKEFSFVVKNKSISEITIVYPYLNNRILQQKSDASVLSNSKNTFTLNHPVFIDRNTFGLAKFFDYCSSNYSVNYISDINLEDKSSFEKSRLLIVYGQISFFSDKMKDNMVDFVKKGGNLMVMSSDFCTNVIHRNNNDFSFNNTGKNPDFRIISWLSKNLDIRKNFGLSAYYGGEPLNFNSQHYNILIKNHPLFKGIEDSIVPIEGKYYIGEFCGWSEDSIPFADKLLFYSNQLLAYNLCERGEKKNNVGGIFLTQPDSTSGKIISLGTGDWCLEKNQKKKTIFSISTNTLDFLLK